MTSTQEFKIVLAGDGGVGKTAFLQRHSTGEFREEYDPTTFGKNWYNLPFQTNYGTLLFRVWDCAGQKKFPRLRKGTYAGAILMFSVTDRSSYKNLDTWNKKVDENVVKVVCGNKVDVKNRNRKVKARYIGWPRRKGYAYYEISAKSNHNFEKPFLYLARKLTGHADLKFVEYPAPLPPPIVKSKQVSEESTDVDEGKSEELESEGPVEQCIICGEVKEMIVGNCCADENCLAIYSAPTFRRPSCEAQVEDIEKEEEEDEEYEDKQDSDDEEDEEDSDDFPEEIISDIKNLSSKSLKTFAYYLGLKWSDTEDMAELIVKHAKKEELDEFPKDVIEKIDGLDEKQLKLIAYYLKLKWVDEEDMVEPIKNRFGETEEEKETQGWGCSMM